MFEKLSHLPYKTENLRFSRVAVAKNTTEAQKFSREAFSRKTVIRQSR